MALGTRNPVFNLIYAFFLIRIHNFLNLHVFIINRDQQVHVWIKYELKSFVNANIVFYFPNNNVSRHILVGSDLGTLLCNGIIFINLEYVGQMFVVTWFLELSLFLLWLLALRCHHFLWTMILH